MAKFRWGIGELKDNNICWHIARPVCWPTVNQLSTDCWPTVNQLLTNCRLTVDQLLTDIATNISLEATYSKHDPTKLHYACVSIPNLKELLKLLKHFKNNQKCCDDFVTNSPQQVTKSMRMHERVWNIHNFYSHQMWEYLVNALIIILFHWQ